MQGNRLEIQTAIQVDRGDDVLQGWSQTTSSLRGSRCRSWSRGSHPSAVLGLTLKQMTAVHCRRLVAGSGGRSELASSAGKRQGTGCSEGLSLRRVGGVSLNGFHFESGTAKQKAETLLILRTRLSRSSCGDEQVNVSPTATAQRLRVGLRSFDTETRRDNRYRTKTR